MKSSAAGYTNTIHPESPPRRPATMKSWEVALRDRQSEVWTRVREHGDQRRAHLSEASTYVLADAIQWLAELPEHSIHAVVTDPPYGLFEYSPEQQEKLRARRGGVWRIPPSFDGTERAPLPRFTVLTARDLRSLDRFFQNWGESLTRVLVPGANVVVASNPLLSYIVSGALARAGLERRGEVVRLDRKSVV